MKIEWKYLGVLDLRTGCAGAKAIRRVRGQVLYSGECAHLAKDNVKERTHKSRARQPQGQEVEINHSTQGFQFTFPQEAMRLQAGRQIAYR